MQIWLTEYVLHVYLILGSMTNLFARSSYGDLVPLANTLPNFSSIFDSKKSLHNMEIWFIWQKLCQMFYRYLTQRLCLKSLDNMEIWFTWQRDLRGPRHLSRSGSEPGRCEPAFGNTERKHFIFKLFY